MRWICVGFNQTEVEAYLYSSWKASNSSIRNGPAELPTGGGTCSMTAGKTVSSPRPVLADTLRHVLGSMSKACNNQLVRLWLM